MTSTTPIKNFKDLEVWKAARNLRHEMYKLAKSLPDVEKFGLASQIRGAAHSVGRLLNGYLRSTLAMKRQAA